MAATKSHLSSPRYGYDIVVATTQASINARMKKYLLGLEAHETRVCFVYKEGTKTNEIEVMHHKDLLIKSNDSDPFSIPNGTAVSGNKDIANLRKAGFIAGIAFSHGLPQNYDPEKLGDLPNIIELQEDASQVLFRMLCADIKIVELPQGSDGSKKWFAMSQNEEPNRTWSIVSKVNLVTDQSNRAWSRLPKSIQDYHKNLSNEMFDVSRLLFDLDDPALASIPEFKNSSADQTLDDDSMVAELFQKYFCSIFFKEMQKQGQPVLSYIVAPESEQDSTLKPTDMTFHVSPLVQETDPDLKTLDCLCATGNKPLPPAHNFEWDWISEKDANVEHGVIAINRTTFAKYLRKRLVEQAKPYCFAPNVKIEDTAPDAPTSFSVWPETRELEIIRDDPGNTNTDGKLVATILDIDKTTNQLLKLSYFTSKEHYINKSVSGWLFNTKPSHSISLSVTYTAIVSATSNKLTIDSSLTVPISITTNHTTTHSGILIQKSFRDTIELAVDEYGHVTATKTTTSTTDTSAHNSVNAFADTFADATAVLSRLEHVVSLAQRFKGTSLVELDEFVFPGGKTFAFQRCRFSEGQDLLCGITYADWS